MCSSFLNLFQQTNWKSIKHRSPGHLGDEFKKVCNSFETVEFEISNVNKKYLTYYKMALKVPNTVGHYILKRGIPTQ